MLQRQESITNASDHPLLPQNVKRVKQAQGFGQQLSKLTCLGMPFSARKIGYLNLRNSIKFKQVLDPNLIVHNAAHVAAGLRWIL